ncbi:MAG: acetate--CoA ligase family protein [Acidimicrobiales bacterium]|nr:acetate--CoA ligase family protein [Acidimicrobiales bacterium]MYG87855.1 acetate--CoA ligase family protein [Acidimicrobiales bacterium]MYI29406.1 acetate--CoA ligase family protein [Acidimicrobiales bacterium]
MTGRLDRLLRPRSLAFVGGVAAERSIDACRAFGFAGEMWGVNPRRTLSDLPTVASVAELPEGIDAAFVGVDHDATIDTVRQLSEAGVGVAVCHASGFAEVGAAGKVRQVELVEAAGAMAVLGPNCNGLLSAPTGAALWPDAHGLVRRPRGVALLSQSGNIAMNLTMSRRGLDVAWVISLGNQADVGISEAFEAVVVDEATTGVGLCMEGLNDIERFVEAAAVARRRLLPVVAVKVGASPSSGAIAVTHTASLVGDDAAYEALFRKMGIHRVHAIDELVDTLATLSAIGPLRGNRMVSLSCSGGEAALVADRSQGRNLSVPQFAPDHAARVASALDGRVAITNPLDYHTYIWGDLDRLSRCFASVLGADATTPGTTAHGETHTDTAGGGSGEAPFDAAMLVLDFPAEGLDRSRWWPTMQAFATACANGDTPGVVAASLAENLPDEARSQAAEWGLAACGDIDNALSALEAAAAWGRHLDDTEPEGGLLVVKAREAPLGTSVLPEHEAKPRLAAAGIEVPMGRLVEPQQAAAAADEIGYPVAVKAVGTAHKSDAGGVAVGLTDAESVAAAAGRIAASVGAPTAVGVRAVMVELCITDVVAELLVSVRSSPPVGMVLTVGAGGTLTEVLDDTASLLLPAGGDTLEALRDLRLWPVLAGYRGRPAGAVDAVVNTVKLLETLVRDDDRIIEVEVNPLLVTPHTAVAADALMVLAND